MTGTNPGGQAPPGQTPARPPSQPPAPPRPGLIIARPLGIPVYISPYWFLIAALFVLFYANSLQGQVAGQTARYVVATAFVLLLYVSVLIHELSHCVVARAFGLPVRRILLYPLGGYSEIEQEPQTPAREFLVSGAGPVLSLAWPVLAGRSSRWSTHRHRPGPDRPADRGQHPGRRVQPCPCCRWTAADAAPGLEAHGRPGTGTIAAAWAGRCSPSACSRCRC